VTSGDERVELELGQGDVRCPKGRDDFDLEALEVVTPIHDHRREPLETCLAEAGDFDAVSGQQRRDAVSVPRSESPPETYRVGAKDPLVELISAHHEKRVVRKECSPDARHTLGHGRTVTATYDTIARADPLLQLLLQWSGVERFERSRAKRAIQ
jgi:hypothetical protein